MNQQACAEPAFVRYLWERYCGCLHGAGSTTSSSSSSAPLDYTDPVVDEIWQLFFPILNEVKLIPVGSLGASAPPKKLDKSHPCEPVQEDEDVEAQEGAQECEDPDSNCGSFPATHVFYIALKGPSTESGQTRGRDFGPGEAVNGGGSGGGGPPAPVLSNEMVSLLCQQPHIVLPLLEFFVALMAYRRRTRAASPAMAATPPPLSASSDQTAQALDAQRLRLLCCVLGDPTQCVAFDELGAARLGQLLTLTGTVVRMSPPRITCVRMTYRCGLCGAMQELATEDGLLGYPGACGGRGRCRGYKWVPMPERAVCEEVQFLKVQEHTDFFDSQRQSLSGSGAKEATGGAYKVVEVELRHPLLDLTTVGDTVCVCGILHTYRGELRRASSSWGGVQHICLRARSIEAANNMWWKTASLTPTHNAASSPQWATETDSWWSPDECARYYEMARHPEWFARLTASVAPSLYGLQREKEAILLAIVGGSSNNKIGCRSGIHVLLLGDPGMGKSQLLRAACAIAPRSAFVCAHTSSSCGLTMTLVRDPMTGGATFEAGAVVHGDGGVTCIDEIDKTSAEHKALLEVMEQESVSIAKAGMVFSMPVHTSILAAGNPIGGRFDFTKPITANVNLSPALLSRFDLVVCLQDRREMRGVSGSHSSGAGAQLDAREEGLTNHVLNLHRRGNLPPQPSGRAAVLPHSLTRQFLLFCRSQCQPMLSPGALAVLKAHYLAARGVTASGEGNGIEGGGKRGGLGASPMVAPDVGCHSQLYHHHHDLITPRYLQALVRIAEARAKVELRGEVAREDAEYAVGLVQDCLRTFAAADSGLAGGTPRNGPLGRQGKKSNQREVVVGLLKEAILRGGGVNRLSHSTILQACEEAGCRDGNAMLHQLNEFGVLLKCGDKYTLRGV